MTTAAFQRIPPAYAGLGEMLAEAVTLGTPEEGLVFAADPALGAGWAAARTELREAFDLTQRASLASAPVVYVVHGSDLLGQRGPERAMVAAGLLSGARSAAFEMLRSGAPVNVLAVTDDTPDGLAAEWIRRLLVPGPGAPTGELIRCGGDHLGKALP